MTHPPRVLVVDDDPDLARLVQTVLAREGMDVTAAGDPREALTLAAGSPFDVLVTDLEMPGMDGLELLDRLRALQPGLPVVVLTAHASVDHAIGALRRQADEFLTKPVDRAALTDAVTRLAAARRLAEGPREVVLAVGAHPDDVELGIGGTLAAHRSAGDQVVVLTLSQGSRGGLPDDRRAESLAAAELIGARLFLEDLPDTLISPADPTVSIIERVVAEVQPTTVYTHSANDRHQDHRAVHSAATVATRGVPTLACFQSPSATVDFRPTRFVTVDGFTATKLALLACFGSQTGRRSYLEEDFVLATTRYWSRYGGGTHCEPLEMVRQAAAIPGALAPSTLASQEIHHVR